MIEVTGGGPGRWEYEIFDQTTWLRLDDEARRLQIWRAIKRRQGRRRRALIKAAGPADRYTVQEIGDRDGWECLICESPVSREFRAPHPCTPSVHHIFAIWQGGADTLDNVVLTHLFCNQNNETSPRHSPAGARAALADRVLYGRYGPGRREQTPTSEDRALAELILGGGSS
ncbi:HNH endonuclease [Actinocorallia sp. A-T 12471]|uniref:HNH endonuclease n=1 Tax=Actinocorallia sp. A-T 12471 TaxID=3089813 RepID=UPI0039B6ECA7